MVPVSLVPDSGTLPPFAASLTRITRYLDSSKLHFTPEGTLELNPAPFAHAAQLAGPCTPLAYAILSLKDTCWSPEDLAGRKILVEGLVLWCRAYLERQQHGS